MRALSDKGLPSNDARFQTWSPLNVQQSSNFCLFFMHSRSLLIIILTCINSSLHYSCLKTHFTMLWNILFITFYQSSDDNMHLHCCIKSCIMIISIHTDNTISFLISICTLKKIQGSSDFIIYSRQRWFF